MKSIHPDILARFDNILKARQLPFLLRPEYRKWLRYFLDFQAKYPQSGERSDQVRLFSDKLSMLMIREGTARHIQGSILSVFA